MNTPKFEGRVKFFKADKGFGFITTGNRDVFFHVSKVKNNIVLDRGDVVQFTTFDDRKGVSAADVELIRKASFEQTTQRRHGNRDREQVNEF